MANESDALDALEKEAKEYDKVSSTGWRWGLNVIADMSPGRRD